MHILFVLIRSRERDVMPEDKDFLQTKGNIKILYKKVVKRNFVDFFLIFFL